MALVCSCHGVTTRRIRDAIARGADTLEAIGEVCEAGTCCMGCHATLDCMLEEAQAAATPVGVRRRRLGLLHA
jgi:bacterioferritin-associated ferredoxin